MVLIRRHRRGRGSTPITRRPAWRAMSGPGVRGRLAESRRRTTIGRLRRDQLLHARRIGCCRRPGTSRRATPWAIAAGLTAGYRWPLPLVRNMEQQQLLLATTSAGKLREWQALLADLPLELVSLRDVGISFDVEETGSTFAENAQLKADAYGTASGLLTLAEDSGLSVSALGGAPGVHSARWQGNDYVHKNALLIEMLGGKQGAARACRYLC